MRLNKIVRLRWSFAILLVAVGIVSLSLKLVCATNQPPVSSPSSNQSYAPVVPPMLHVQGSWDLIWKDENGVSLRAHCRIHQNGAILSLHISGANLPDVDTRTPIDGLIEEGTVSFSMHRKDGKSVVFKGTMEDGILYGTTNRGFSWMAIRKPV